MNGTILKLGDISVAVTRKNIKNVHLSVHPPMGEVRVSAPSRMKLDTIRVYTISKLDWIKGEQRKLRAQKRETPREYLDRESHYLWGRRYLLEVVKKEARPKVTLKHSAICLHVRPRADAEKRREVLDAWYRQKLKDRLPKLIAKWETALDVTVDGVFVQKMRTKWGSCNTAKATIRLNTELAKKRPAFLDYVVLHEMAHLLIRPHNDDFRALLDLHMPNWQQVRKALNDAPISE
ncbi:MAG: M48 family metallopeptidase [Hyphomicrobiaceae bacterium]